MTKDMKFRVDRVFGETDSTTAEMASRLSCVKFIRGRAQLTRARAHHSAPQGHVLTAREAFEAYGLEVLEEATEYGSAVLLSEPNAAGNSIRRQRESLGLEIDQIANYADIGSTDMQSIEESSGRGRVTVRELELVAFMLGLDEAQIAYQGVPADTAIAARLKSMGSSSENMKMSPASVLTFTEAASVIRMQHRLMESLGLSSSQRANFNPDGYYGNSGTPAWKVGQELSNDARMILGIGNQPIGSMRELVEDVLCIPVVRAEIPQTVIAGATISVADGDKTYRGMVLNLNGDHRNPLVTRATMAHEMAHLLYDPDEYLNEVTVDTYDGLARDPTSALDLANENQYVEQRANSFAINFLAPVEKVRDISMPPFSRQDVSRVVSKYGISVTAASYHVVNASYQRVNAPRDVPYDNGDAWRGAEDFTADYFPIQSTRYTRRGRFARLVVRAWKTGAISTETAAQHLCCSVSEFESQADKIA